MFAKLFLFIVFLNYSAAQFYGYGYPAYPMAAPMYYPPVAPVYYQTYPSYPVYYRPYYHNPVRSMIGGALAGATLGFWGKK